MTPDRSFRAIDAIIVVVMIFVVLSLLVVSLPKSTPGHVAAIAGGLATVGGMVVGIWVRRKSPWTVLAPGRFSPNLVFWTLVGTAGISLILVSLQQPIVDLFPRAKPELEKLNREISDYPAGVLILLIALMAPVIEEMLFRGVLLKGFRSSWGVVAGLLVSSALFGLVHGIVPRMIITFFVGLWLGSLALRSEGLAIPILAHAFHNGVVLVLGYSGLMELPVYCALPGGAAVLLAAWRLFRSRARSMQGLDASGPS